MTAGILMILPCLQENTVVFFSSRHEITANSSSVWTNSLEALPKSHFTLKYLICIQLKTPGPWNIFHIGPFISLTDKNSDIRGFEVFPFSTLTCAQRFDRSSMICESDWLSAEAVSPSSARTDTWPKENLYFNVIATVLGLLLIVFGINGNSAS